MPKTGRRKFIKTASAAALLGSSALLTACGTNTNNRESSPNINTGKTYDWKMVTTWPPNFPIFGELLPAAAKWLEEMSSGRLKVQVYGGGELVPPFESFDAVSQGIAEMGHGAAYYWAGKIPAAQFFTTVPFGMTAQQTNAWLYYGGGLELWQNLYANYNVITFPAGNTGGQMGGWFNKEINSIADFSGLKIRMPGLGGKVAAKAGASAVLSPGSEIYTNLERGVIDAAEWIGPDHDYTMGFHKIAKFYYYPGSHEPSACCDLFINKAAYESLPKDLQEMVAAAARALNVMILSEFEARNTEFTIKMKAEGVQFREFSAEVLTALKGFTTQVIDETIAADAESKKVFESYNKFHKDIYQWTSMVERNYQV